MQTQKVVYDLSVTAGKSLEGQKKHFQHETSQYLSKFFLSDDAMTCTYCLQVLFSKEAHCVQLRQR